MSWLESLQRFFYTFIPIFVAMDIAGLIPMYLSLTKNHSDTEKKRTSMQALQTAFIISVLFIFIGKFVFHLLGISGSDFQIAGGLLLLVLSVVEMLSLGEQARAAQPNVGHVPLGTPLLAGPAVLTSLVILTDLQGYVMTLTAFVINLLIAAVAFRYSRALAQRIGQEGLRATSQVISLFLAAIAVSMIRRGLLH